MNHLNKDDQPKDMKPGKGDMPHIDGDLKVDADRIVDKETLILNHKILITRDISQLIREENKEAFQCFEFNTLKKIVYFPSNYLDLVDQDEFLKLALLCVRQSGYNISVIDKDYQRFKKWSDENIVSIKTLQAILDQGELPECPSKVKGTVTKTLFSVAKTISASIKYFDPRWCLFEESERLVPFLLGEEWGKKFKDEKRLLDLVTFTVRNFIKFDAVSYLKRAQTLKKDFGLEVKGINQPVFFDYEQELIRSLPETKNYVIPKPLSLKNEEEAKDFSQVIIDRQNAVRQIKKVIDDMRNRRMTAVFGNRNKQELKKIKNVPIRHTVNTMDEIHRMKEFDPSDLLLLYNVRVNVPPITHKDWEKIYVEEFKETLNTLYKDYNVDVQSLNLLEKSCNDFVVWISSTRQ